MPANTILDLVKQYWWVVIIIVLGIIIFLMWTRRPKQKKLTPISRREYEKKFFMERMRVNPSPLKWLYKGTKLLGKIKYMRGNVIEKPLWEKQKVKVDEDVEIDKNVKIGSINREVYEMVITPMLIDSLKITNPFAKPLCMIVLRKDTTYNYGEDFLEIDPRKPFDQVYGIFYQYDEEFDLVEFIQDKTIFRTDMEKTSDQYFAESLKRSAIDQDHAHAEAMAREELEIELAKRRGKQSTI